MNEEMQNPNTNIFDEVFEGIVSQYPVDYSKDQESLYYALKMDILILLKEDITNVKLDKATKGKLLKSVGELPDPDPSVNRLNNLVYNLPTHIKKGTCLEPFAPIAAYTLFSCSDGNYPAPKKHKELLLSELISKRKNLFDNIGEITKNNLLQKLLSWYYIEKVFSYNLKIFSANCISQHVILPYNIYSSKCINEIKYSVIARMVKNNKFDFEVINNGKKINPDNFYGLTKYLTKEERILIEKALDSEKIDTSFIEKPDGDIDTKKQKGYTLFVLIYCKSICLELQERAQEVQYTLSIRETRETQYIDTIDVTLKQIDVVLDIIDNIFQLFQLSSPGDESFPKKEMILSDIFSTQNKESPKYNNREFEDSPSFVKVLKPTSPNAADTYYIPDENFDIHNIQVNIRKAECCITDTIETFNHLGIRSFKKDLLKIVNNCFKIPTIARKDNNYICETLYPTKQIFFKSAITNLLVLELLTNIPYPLCRFKLYMKILYESNSSDIISKFSEDHSDENNYDFEQFTAFEREKLENSRAYKFALFLKTNKIFDSVSEELLKRFNNSAQDYISYVQEVYNKEIEEYLTDLHSKYTDVSDKDKLEEELQYKITST